MNFLSGNLDNRKWLPFALLLLMIICFVIVNLNGHLTPKTKVIDGDGSGLYAYLPALLIYKTVDFKPILEYEKSQRASDYTAHYFHEVDQIYINKFTIGTALFQLPFFLLAWLLSVIFGYPVDGYNILFQYSVAFAALFWAFTGLCYFIKLSVLYGIKKQIAYLIAIAGFLGTNMFYYALMAPAASHIYSFAAIAIFLFYAKNTFLNYNRRSLILSSLFFGLIILIRPVNILIIFSLTFLSGSPSVLAGTIKKTFRRKDYLFTLLIFLLAVSPQMIINYLQTEQILVYGYKNEGFYFDNPEINNFLYSYRKGWFVYTPFMLLLLPSVLYLFRRSFFELISFTGFFALLVYVFSSWWNWIYGDSFGMRPMVDYYTLFFLIIALMAGGIKSKVLVYSFSGLFVLFITLNLIQIYQYNEKIIHPDSMNKQAYWYVFLKTGFEYKNIIADEDEYFYGELSERPFFETAYSFENDVDGWSIPSKLFFIPDNKHTCIKLDQKSIYSSSFNYKIPSQLVARKNIYIWFKTSYLEPAVNNAKDALFVVDISDKSGKTIFYKAFKVKRLPDTITNNWRPGHIGFKLPEILEKMDKIKFYIWNKEKQEFYIQSMGLQFYTYGDGEHELLSLQSTKN